MSFDYVIRYPTDTSILFGSGVKKIIKNYKSYIEHIKSFRDKRPITTESKKTNRVIEQQIRSCNRFISLLQSPLGKVAALINKKKRQCCCVDDENDFIPLQNDIPFYYPQKVNNEAVVLEEVKAESEDSLEESPVASFTEKPPIVFFVSEELTEEIKKLSQLIETKIARVYIYPLEETITESFDPSQVLSFVVHQAKIKEQDSLLSERLQEKRKLFKNCILLVLDARKNKSSFLYKHLEESSYQTKQGLTSTVLYQACYQKSVIDPILGDEMNELLEKLGALYAKVFS